MGRLCIRRMLDVDADEEALLIQWILFDKVLYRLSQSQLIGSSLVNTSDRRGLMMGDIARSSLADCAIENNFMIIKSEVTSRGPAGARLPFIIKTSRSHRA